MIEEQWKPVKDYEELYEVSNYGEVKSLERLDSKGRKVKEKLLKPQKNSNGYLQVDLYKNGVKKFFLIHRLVWQTFVGEIPEGLQCNHIDEEKENCCLDNLNLMSPSQNINWGTRNARSAAAKSKPVEAVDKVTGRVIYTFPSTQEAGRNGFHQGAVAACCRNCFSRPGNNVYKGFIWRYV